MPTEKPARASGVSAAEKYAELEARGEERPRCECHGELKTWNRSKQSPRGGNWLCTESHRLNKARWLAANRERKREQGRAWAAANPEKIRAKDRRRAARLLAAGICARCRKEPLATADGWNCNACLDKLLTPEKTLAKRRKEALRRRENRQTGRANG